MLLTIEVSRTRRRWLAQGFFRVRSAVHRW
jgi:hypothetical protein